MQKILYLLLLLGSGNSCLQTGISRQNENSPTTALSLPPTDSSTWVILVYDLSQSDTFLNPDTAVWVQWLYGMGVGGFELTGIRVQSDSYQQDLYASHFVRMDTLPPSRNYILDASNRQENRHKMAMLHQRCGQVARELCASVFLPQTHLQSDVNNALRWANITARHYERSPGKIVVVIVSDLLHDMTGNPQMPHPVVFPKGTRILLVGNAPEVDIRQVFPGQDVEELPSFQHLLTAK